MKGLSDDDDDDEEDDEQLPRKQTVWEQPARSTIDHMCCLWGGGQAHAPIDVMALLSDCFLTGF